MTITIGLPRPAGAISPLDAWIQNEAIPFSFDSSETGNAAIDRVVAGLGGEVELLGFGEALHGGEEILQWRNRIFQRLVQAHGYRAIAVESSFPRARAVDEYIVGGGGSWEALRDAGFSFGFRRLEANRELVEWMRSYNADPAHPVKLRFYGFDSPTAMTGTDSPRRLLEFALDYLAVLDPESARQRRERITTLLGADADWENPAALMDPAQSVGLSPAAAALRVETEDLIVELRIRRPDAAPGPDADRQREALRYAELARDLLSYHAATARHSPRRLVELLGLRDAMMADNLEYMVRRERGRGKVLAFAHNSHLRRGKVRWQLGPDELVWWPAGAHLDRIFGEGYAVIGSALGVSEANGIGVPEAGSLEDRLSAQPGPALFIPTRRGEGIPAAQLAALPPRSGSTRNPTYFPLSPDLLAEFDWLAVLDSTGYTRGAPPLPEPAAVSSPPTP